MQNNHPTNPGDLDPKETSDWLDSLDKIGRAHV